MRLIAIDERFRDLTTIGHGSMGTVYKAWDKFTAAHVALKVPTPSMAVRFEREANVLSFMAHPNIVRHLAHGRSKDGVPWLAMEWLEGEELEARLLRSRLSVWEALDVARPIASALSWAHKRKVLHRDLKPSNLFLVGGALHNVKLLDFGIARPTVFLDELTATGTFMGTCGYMPPEQRIDAKRADVRSDVYALGAVLFHALTGAPPEAFDPKLRESGVPTDLAALIERMLATDRDRRPRDGSAVLDALEEIQTALWDAPTVATRLTSEVRSVTVKRGPTGTVVMPYAASQRRR
jgi:serine/threonine protein kinase